jgi:hypothetical protein
MDGGRDDAEASLSDAQTVGREAESEERDPSHWSRYTTAALRQLLERLEAMENKPVLTIAGVKAELERRSDVDH